MSEAAGSSPAGRAGVPTRAGGLSRRRFIKGCRHHKRLWIETFIADRSYAAIDVLLVQESGFTLIGMKSTLRVKDEPVLDAALQAHVALCPGIDVRRVEVICLYPDHAHPGPVSLFLRGDVTERVEALLPTQVN